jgi:uncharacterized protein (TIGR00255 family)
LLAQQNWIFATLAPMIQSMTGFGKSQLMLGSKTITIDIRTLNSKQFDLNLRIPSFLREQEGLIRNRLNQELERGKVDIHFSVKSNNGLNATGINIDVIEKRFAALLPTIERLGVSADALFSEIMRMPDVVSEEEQALEDSEWKEIESALILALAEVNVFRSDEGKGLAKELLMRVDEIEKSLELVASCENERMESVRLRLKQKIDEMLQQNAGSENRFEEEMIYFLEKLDISEEKQRLSTHCNYFRDVINEPKSNGRKLNFISQEMGREINTIGSKANHAGMQKLVVLMKDELEKIKEQLNNVL